MAPKLRPQQQLLLELLSKRKIGDTLTEATILDHTKWTSSTLRTYRQKHVLDPFLMVQDDGSYRTLREGKSLTEDELAAAFTQNRPEKLVLTRGMKLVGSKATYELINFMGNGAVAHVWRCSDKVTGIAHAAKIMNPRPDLLEPTNLENVKKRFVRESKNGARISHPNVVAYQDYGEISEHPFLIMELAEKSLADTMKTRQLSLPEAIEAVGACLRGLEQLHDIGCIHRDVKPHNILCFKDRFALGDLGIVRWPDMNSAFTSAGTLTKASIQLGSWYYMAPEQRRSPHEALPASDVYALGISWYEMLTGNTPDPADVAAQEFAAASKDDKVAQIVREMLAHKPTERPTVKQLLSSISEMGLKFTSPGKPKKV